MRWCRKEKIIVKIPRPVIVDRYNRNMGGVDLSDMLLELFKVNHRSKKRYMRIVYWCMNVTVVNSWLLHRLDHKQLFERTKHMRGQLFFAQSIAIDENNTLQFMVYILASKL